MKILVTGGLGFIGSHLVEFLLSAGEDVIVLDAKTYAGVNKVDCETVIGRIEDPVIVSNLSRRVDAVINLAAETHVDNSINNPGVFVKSNVLGTQVLLDCFKGKRMVQVSTDEVYGSITEGRFTENTPLSPNSPYSASKAGADLLCLVYNHTYKQDIVITRCSNNYGPRQFPEKLIPLTLSRLKGGKNIPIYGDGMNVRDWLYVKDHCSAIYATLKAGKAGEVYNIGTNEEKTNIEIAKFILNYLNLPESRISYVKDRAGHDKRYAIDSSKIQKELGWTPVHQFEEWMPKTIESYL